MPQPGRTYSAGTLYRYGFNGKERDDEINGEGNKLDFGARIYDSRIGRWLSVDPAIIEYPGYSPYNFGLNNPVINLDNDGKRVYYCPGLGGRGNDEKGRMYGEESGAGSAYLNSIGEAFRGSGVYYKELQKVNGQRGYNNLKLKNNPRITDAGFVAKFGRTPVLSLNDDDRIRSAVGQIIEDITNNPLGIEEKMNLVGTSMGAVTTAQAALYMLEHKDELGLGADFRIDNVVLAGSVVNQNSELYKRLEDALANQTVNGKPYAGRLLSGKTDSKGQNGYNYPASQDGVTGLAGKTKVGMILRFARLLGQVVSGFQIKLGRNKKGRFGVKDWDINHPHTKAADNPNFGDGLIQQALINDKIEGEQGAEGAKKYLKNKPKE